MAPAMSSTSCAATPGGIDGAHSEYSTVAVSDDTSPCSDQQQPQRSCDPRMPDTAEFWNCVSEKNTFLCVAEECTWFQDVDFETRRSCSCPPRLETDDGGSTSSLTPRSEWASSRMSTSSGMSDAAEVVCNTAAASGTPSTKCPTPLASFQDPRLESVARTEPVWASNPQGLCAARGETMDGGAEVSVSPASRQAAIRQKPKTPRAHGQNHTEPGEGGAEVGPRHPAQQEARAERITPAFARRPKCSAPRSNGCSDAAESLGTTKAHCGSRPRLVWPSPPRTPRGGSPLASAAQKPRPHWSAPANQSTTVASRPPRGGGGGVVDGAAAASRLGGGVVDGAAAASRPGLPKAAKPAATKQNQKGRKDRGQKHAVQLLGCVDEFTQGGASAGRFQAMSKLVIPLGVCTTIALAFLFLQRFASLTPAGPAVKDVAAKAVKSFKVAAGRKRCWPTAFSSLSQYSVPDRQRYALHRSLPVITLYAPCPLTTFVRVANRFPGAALEWNFVESVKQTKVVMQHHLENPRSLRADLADEDALKVEIGQFNIPAVGLFSPANFVMYSGRSANFGRGLAIFFPEPDVDGPIFDKKYRQELSSAFQGWRNQMDVSYVLTGRNHDLIESEFGVTSFPSLVFQREFPGKPYVYSGDLSEASVRVFLEDVERGCYDYRPHDMSAFFQKPRRLVCDAGVVLGKP